MKISHIEHLGIAVKSIEEALPYYENVLGLKCYNIETVEDQKVRLPNSSKRTTVTAVCTI